MKNTNWNKADLLEMVEIYAEDHNRYHQTHFIEDESDLSVLFDEMVNELPDNGTRYKIKNHEDPLMAREWFNSWKDGLCADGVLHPEQYRQYTYCGEFNLED